MRKGELLYIDFHFLHGNNTYCVKMSPSEDGVLLPVMLIGSLGQESHRLVISRDLSRAMMLQDQYLQSAWRTDAAVLVRDESKLRSEPSHTQDSNSHWVIISHRSGFSCCFVFLPQPWTLDSSISEENREIIESMLLEEQYPYAE